MSIQEKINGMLKENRVMLFMKGSPYQPQCGFSARTVKALMECDVVFSYVDILDNPEIRQTLPDISDCPTFPQLFVDGELIGGCDIITEMHSNGELKEVLTEAIN